MSPKPLRWVGGVNCLGLFPKKNRFFFTPSLILKTFTHLFPDLVVKYWIHLYMFTVTVLFLCVLCFVIRIKLFHAVSSEGEIECFRFSGTLHAGFIDGAYWLISTPSLTNWNLPDTIHFTLSWVQTDLKTFWQKEILHTEDSPG